MKRTGSHFSFDRHQRNGILLLCIFLTISQVLLWLIDGIAPRQKGYHNSDKIRALQDRRDSLRKSHVQNTIRQIRPFNPNYLDEFRAYNLGMDLDAYNRLSNFRKDGNKINSSEEFVQLTQIDDSLFLLLKPLLLFPSTSNRVIHEHIRNPETKSDAPITGDLNRVSAQELIRIRGIGAKLSKRIIAYRAYLGGYSTNEQLFEVYHLPEETARLVLSRYQVLESPVIEKVNVNSASFKELLKLPYLDFELTKKIVRFRQEHGSLINLDELKQIDSFPGDKFDRIALYLLAE